MLENMLDYLRIVLYTLFLIVVFFLFQAWNQDHTKVEPPSAIQPAATSERFVPTIPETTKPIAAAPQSVQALASAPSKDAIVQVTTDLLDVSIDTRGGDIIAAKLLKYPDALGSTQPIILLNDDPKTRYLAESGLLSSRGPDTPQEQALYHTEQPSYALNPGENTLSVKLNWQNNEGIRVSKIFSFARGSYEIKVDYQIDNESNLPWEGNLYTQLLRTNVPPPSHGGMANLTTFFGAAFSSPAKPFEKISFKQMQEKNISQAVEDGWAAMVQHYFISAWIPAPTAISTYYTRVMPNGLYAIGLLGSNLTVPSHAQATTGAKLYVGPTIANELEKAAPKLKLTIDYGWFWFISGIIFWMMQKIYDVIGNWGWSIVIVTIIIKLLFYHLSAKSYRSMSALKKLQPRIESLRERYGDDRQKLTQETLNLYRQEKVNPMSGCLPILVQIPVFIALYWVLVESVQLRQAPFILWIHDLSQADPYYILPLLMGVSMYFQQRLNPPPPDPLQAKVMMLMPWIFTILFANFPAGLMLYWFVNTTLSFLQQWYIMHSTNLETKTRD